MLLNTCKFLLMVLAFAISIRGFAQKNARPNVILIITDDQGYGDLGINGNTLIKTPFIDEFAKKSLRFNNFHVSPVCAPTRSSLMTGRYSLRTGIRDTYNGGAIMASNEITIAELLKQVGYQTGLFGKWHLGDNYPSRPMDQGFDESLMHLSGGMGQVGDVTTYFQKDSSYFNPILWKMAKRNHLKVIVPIFSQPMQSSLLKKIRTIRFFVIYPLMPHIPHCKYLMRIIRCTKI